jgi:hypothetical protein
MRAAIGLVIACVLAATPAPAGAEKKDKPKQGKGSPHAQGGEGSAASAPGGSATVSVTVAFTTGQREAVHGWFAESYGRGNCPPGLAKKNNGCLPPGQAKKRYRVGHPLPAEVRWSPPPPSLTTRLGPPPAGYLYVSLDGDLLKLAVGTMLVVDAIQGLVD